MPPSTAGGGIDQVTVVLVEDAVQAAEVELPAADVDEVDEVDAPEPADALSPELVMPEPFSAEPLPDPSSDAPAPDDPDDVDSEEEEDALAPALAGDRLSLR